MYPPFHPRPFPDFAFWLVSESQNKVVGEKIGYGLSLQRQELGILLKVAPPFDKKLFFRVTQIASLQMPPAAQLGQDWDSIPKLFRGR